MIARRPRQSGLALVMVITTLAVASLLAMSMLSASALQAQMADSVPRVAQADYLAESGLHWGIAKLRESAGTDEFNEPLSSNPALLGKTYGPLSLNTAGQCTVSITRGNTWDDYNITSSAVFTNPAGKTIAQATSEARVKASVNLVYTHAAVIGVAADINSSLGTLTFDSLAVKGNLRLAGLNNNVTGKAWATGFMGTTTTKLPNNPTRRGVFVTGTNPTAPMKGTEIGPRPNNVRTFESYAWSDGKVYSAGTLPVSAGVCSNVTLGATAANPAGIYRHHGDLRLGSNVRINGTLVVTGGNLTLDGPGSADLFGSYAIEIDATSTHSRRFPALVVPDGGVYFTSTSLSNRVLRVKGVTYVSNAFGSNGSSGIAPILLFEGSVILPSAVPLTRGTMTFKAVSNTDTGNTNVPMLDHTLEADSIEVVRWKSTTQ
jgi:Tfp pilus assembly protein PilX